MFLKYPHKKKWHSAKEVFPVNLYHLYQSNDFEINYLKKSTSKPKWVVSCLVGTRSRDFLFQHPSLQALTSLLRIHKKHSYNIYFILVSPKPLLGKYKPRCSSFPCFQRLNVKVLPNYAAFCKKWKFSKLSFKIFDRSNTYNMQNFRYIPCCSKYYWS